MKDSTALIIAAIVILGVTFAPAQISDYSWKLKPAHEPGYVQFTIERSRIGNHSSHSNNVPFDRFRGLSQDAIERGGAVKFEYVHDAGRLSCEGRFLFSRGSGSYTFTPDPGFTSKLQRLGYETPDEDQLFSMMTSDVSLEFARDVKDAVVEASTRDLIDLRIHGVRTSFLRDLKGLGYSLPARDIIQLRIHGVSSELMSDLKRSGYEMSVREIVQLRIHGVQPSYLRALKDAGYSSLRADEITQLRIHGVPADFIGESKALGYNFTAKELTDLRIHGVNADYLRRLRDSGMRNLTAAQIAKLRIHGVN